MNKEKRKAIEELAQGVRKYYNIGIPFADNIDSLLEKLGGKVERREPEGWCYSKLYFRTATWESKFTIRVSPTLRKESQYYEIAMQIGHLFLHTTFVDTIEDDTKALLITKDVSCVEYGMEANQFANELIMPKDEFIKVVHENTEDDMVKMKFVAEKFGVTYDIATVRAKMLNLVQC